MNTYIKDDNKSIKIIKIIAISLWIFIFIEFILTAVFFTKNNWHYRNDYFKDDYFLVKDYLEDIVYAEDYTQITALEGRELVRQIIKPKLYIEINKNLGRDIMGETLVLLRLVYINETLFKHALINDYYIPEYIMVLTHEYIHLTEWTACDLYVDYKTFITLYNSDNNYLHWCGCLFALNMLCGAYSESYDCSYYIINYLKDIIKDSK